MKNSTQNKWQLQNAKNRFSELVDKALESGPQVVTRRGKDAVVVLSSKQYAQMTAPKQNIVDFFQQSPLAEVDLDLKRQKDTPRKVKL